MQCITLKYIFVNQQLEFGVIPDSSTNYSGSAFPFADPIPSVREKRERSADCPICD